MSYTNIKYSLVITERAAKELKRMPSAWKMRIIAKLNLLAKAPRGPNNNAKPLVGSSSFRLRVGDYRIIYEIDDAARVLTVTAAGMRGRLY